MNCRCCWLLIPGKTIFYGEAAIGKRGVYQYVSGGLFQRQMPGLPESEVRVFFALAAGKREAGEEYITTAKRLNPMNRNRTAEDKDMAGDANSSYAGQNREDAR